MLRPASIGELCDIFAEGGPYRLRGGGSKDAIGAEVDATVVDMRGFAGVSDYDPPELVLTVRAGTPLAEVQALVASEGQMLAFDPFDHAAILGGEARATIGGVIAAGVAGPARLSRGAARDYLLGFTAVSGRAQRFVAGAKVVKNVTGYDLPKLITGSWGRLAAITELTLKVLPAPREQQTIVLRGLDPATAVAAMSKAMGSSAEVTAAAHLPDWEGCAITALRLDGFPSSIAARRETLGGLETIEGTAIWEAVRHATPLPADKPLWRCIIPAGRAPAFVSALSGDWLFDWAGGLVWLASDAEPQAIRTAASAAGGHAMLVRADAAMRAAVRTLHPQPIPLAALEERVRRAFDPEGIFEMGRFEVQTGFTPAQLADPAMASSEGVIRKCVHCGFCTATCPTYVLLGDELDSPRGRIYMIKDMLENERQPSAEVVRHVDRCLSCLSCMTTCPSGVNYMHLVDHARAYIHEHYDRHWHERMLRSILAWVLPHPGRFRLALTAAKLGRPFAPLFVGVFKPFAAMLALAPRNLPRPAGTASSSVPGAKGRVALLQGCAEPVLRPEFREAAVRLLNRAEHDVIFAPGEGCCGALVHHMGREEDGLASARRNVDAWTREIEGGGLAAIIVTASGCGTTIKDYGFMLRNDPAYAEKAARVSALAKDISEWLIEADLPQGDGRGLTVAYHAACSLQHGQKVTDAPKRLLAQAGYIVRTPIEAHLCCGSAGTYNILQPEIAGQLGDRKAANLARLNADVIATGNIGCAMQIAPRAGVPVVHTIELLDWATGGPIPPQFTARNG